MRRLLIAALAALAFAGPAAAQAPARLGVVLAPKPGEGMGVTMTMASPALKAGEGLVRMPLRLVGIPRPTWADDRLTAKDDRGAIPLTQSDEPPTPQGVYRRWSVGRATVGDVVVAYVAPARKVTAATNNGPLFDLREEAGGFAGAGNGFLAAPVRSGPWSIHLTWDLSASAPGSRGVWSLGEGAVDTVGPSELLQFSYYYAGPVKSYPKASDPHFSFYWLSDPPFDPNELGDKMRALYGSMARFFDDEGGSYRVFVRQNPFLGTGGTGLARSFMFGYNFDAKPTVDSLQGLLAHEMAHTWPAMQGEHGDTAWYSEGMAEYYSTVLSHRAGAISVDRVVKTFNERAAAYYSNPYIAYTNPEAAKVFWTDPVAQTVPYGRGWMYLQQTDAAIRAATGGKRSLDDIVTAIRKRQVANQPYGIPVWVELVGADIGKAKAQAMYDDMAAGKVLLPPKDLYAPCLSVVRRDVRPFQLGFARSSLNDDRVVKDLVAGSAADQAGVRNGDVIVQTSDVNEVRKDDTKSITLTLKRGEAQTTVTYLPRGAPVEGWGWERTAGVPDSACKF
ncbi:hypothetical protein [Phenylobacterium sp.]|uniref:M61 family metallopeptidase n=1 Tax=Phenylobacterium sp. TaxID=1871053 RepID=UPI0025FD853A|nr:hypothetical protein [Phenylobacterium sp.]MBX3484875.1 hypothetical protein [Phenylobacterium sp.]MCW5758701.1 hypothetical protein [Phenylobacterium sp.]